MFNLTPDPIYAYLANKAFGTTQPLDIDKPTQGRTNFIEYAKNNNFVFHAKQIDEVGFTKNSGNTTKLVKHNELIKKSKASVAQRLMELTEFVEVIER